MFLGSSFSIRVSFAHVFGAFRYVFKTVLGMFAWGLVLCWLWVAFMCDLGGFYEDFRLGWVNIDWVLRVFWLD